ncbi:MAG: hypothetical protein HY319_20705, partial [Armatimonadetes bacterium]|nr:hypothetical protein [Armatimonadota bacterium]
GRARCRLAAETGVPGRARCRLAAETGVPGRARCRLAAETRVTGRARCRRWAETRAPGRRVTEGGLTVCPAGNGRAGLAGRIAIRPGRTALPAPRPRIMVEGLTSCPSGTVPVAPVTATTVWATVRIPSRQGIPR